MCEFNCSRRQLLSGLMVGDAALMLGGGGVAGASSESTVTPEQTLQLEWL